MFPNLTADQLIILILAVFTLAREGIGAYNKWRVWKGDEPQRHEAVNKAKADTESAQASAANSMASAAQTMLKNYQENQSVMQSAIEELKRQALETSKESMGRIDRLNDTIKELKSAATILKEQIVILTKNNADLQGTVTTLTNANVLLEKERADRQKMNDQLRELGDKLSKIQVTTTTTKDVVTAAAQGVTNGEVVKPKTGPLGAGHHEADKE